MSRTQPSNTASAPDEATTRDLQREETRERILKAAREAFAEKGFLGASTRDIARRADANQGLITYHFSTKEELWRAAADSLFTELGDRLTEQMKAVGASLEHDKARAAIREYVRFAADYPELFRLLVDEGRVDDERLRWLIKTHMKPRYEAIARNLLQVAGLDEAALPHAFYALAGAASLIFAVAPECRLLTGLNPTTKAAIERHADFVAQMFVPDEPA